MRVFVAGATGVIGKQLVPQLLAGGHEVVAMTRSQGKVEDLEAAGATPVVADGLDGEAVRRAVLGAEPGAVVHELTALSSIGGLRNPDRGFELTNRLRTEGLDYLLAAAREAGARRFLAQSYAGGWPYAPEGGPVKDEDDPLDPSPPRTLSRTLDAIRHLEAATVGADGIEGLVLRYGALYGPGTNMVEGGEFAELVRRRRFPIVGDGTGVWSFVHVEDAASATAAAVERGAPGVYNVVDDDPAPASEWLPTLAEALGAKPPRRVPTWLARIAGGEAGVSMMTQSRGASNAKAKRELGWAPRYPSWREGFRAEARLRRD
jgi:nucleoside-diphosphate-sugar epimerase